jgi:hypothetical protein
MVTANQTSFMGWRTGEPFIFVSYAREDCYFVYPEIERLKAEGYSIWYDKKQIRPGRSWSNEINEALKSCCCFLVFITMRAVGSERVKDEIRRALYLKKPLIAIYWQKVVLPPELQDHLQDIQGLEFFDMDRPTYELQLGRALSESVEPKPRPKEPNDLRAPTVDVTSSHITPGISPKLICFILTLLGALFSFLAIVTAAMPFFGSHVPGDPLANPLSGFLVGSFFLAIAIGLYIAAFAVYRNYLRRK